MSYKIAIASGKGGTGKTTVAVNLYHSLWNKTTKKIQLVDCDVEEPNDVLFFEGANILKKKIATQLIPEIDTAKCTFCRQCAEYCEFNAIVIVPPAEFAEVTPGLCHSCGACSAACQYQAITEHPEPIGEITWYDTGIGEGLVEGNLKIGSAMQTMMIKELKKQISDGHDIIVFDAPPGTSCPVVETVADVNYVILVTEPTPFGLHDLKLTVALLREMQKPFGVVVNKSGIGNDEVLHYIKEEQLELLGTIPYDSQYASNYAKGELLNNIPLDIEQHYMEIANTLETNFIHYEGDHYFKW
jgi:MinD superfamily P-loop ATPase